LFRLDCWLLSKFMQKAMAKKQEKIAGK